MSTETGTAQSVSIRCVSVQAAKSLLATLRADGWIEVSSTGDRVRFCPSQHRTVEHVVTVALENGWVDQQAVHDLLGPPKPEVDSNG